MAVVAKLNAYTTTTKIQPIGLLMLFPPEDGSPSCENEGRGATPDVRDVKTSIRAACFNRRISNAEASHGRAHRPGAVRPTPNLRLTPVCRFPYPTLAGRPRSPSPPGDPPRARRRSTAG